MGSQSTARVAMRRVTGSSPPARAQIDALAVEEPLEIRVVWREKGGAAHERPLAVTMRTPGQDRELAVGFLCAEGVLTTRDDLAACAEVGDNRVRVELAPGCRIDLASLERHFYVTSSCGVCGKATIDAVRARRAHAPAIAGPRWATSVVCGLPETLRRAQAIFDATGGLHAAGLFDLAGRLTRVHEDVGRHNALDKLCGAAFLEGTWPLREHAVLLSGRASFELLQKASMAGIPLVAAVGAPSSLAVELAREAGITLLGFVRQHGFNVYTGHDRIFESPHG
jgi:FdhD protein